MIFLEKLIKYIKDNNFGELKENVSFKTLTTYRTGGVARLVFFPKDVDSLRLVIKYLKDNDILFKVFGNGSNILASDNFYDGVIIKLNSLNEYDFNDGYVSVGAGYNFALLCNKLSRDGFTGLEFGGGIPATVGGAVYMNAGAYLAQVSDVLDKVDILDENFDIKTLSVSELDYSYRHSIFMSKNWIILKAYFKLGKGNSSEIVDLINDRKERRVKSQPLEYPSAGSVFRNPEGMYAGKLIEDCELKGYLYNGAQISDKHANFIINKNNATSSDIYYLMELARNKVKEKYNVDLYREQELFNWEK